MDETDRTDRTGTHFSPGITMDWYTRSLEFWFSILGVVPWLCGVAGSLMLVSRSEIGRALMRYLNERERDSALTEALLHEVEALRCNVGEVIDRLDATERGTSRSLPPGPAELRDADRTPTPV